MLYDESGGNPFYLEQLARSLAAPTSPSAVPARTTGRRRGSAARRGGAERGAGAPVRRPRASCSRARPSRAILRAGAGRGGGGDARAASRIDALDELLRARPRPRHRRAAAVPLPASARPPRGVRVDAAAAGAWARTSGAPTRSRLAVRRRRRARTTSSARRARATRPRSRSFERPARRPRSVRRRAPRAGSQARCGSLPEDAPAEERVELLLARAALTGRDRAVRREPAGPARGRCARARRVARAARAADDGLRGRRAPARPPRAGPRSGWRARLTRLDDAGVPRSGRRS